MDGVTTPVFCCVVLSWRKDIS